MPSLRIRAASKRSWGLGPHADNYAVGLVSYDHLLTKEGLLAMKERSIDQVLLTYEPGGVLRLLTAILNGDNTENKEAVLVYARRFRERRFSESAAGAQRAPHQSP